MLSLNLLYFVTSCSVLIVSGIFLVKSLSKIARLLGISEFSAAFIIMAVATSIPELFIGVTSAFAGNSSLSLGNIIGANIINLTLITGIIALLGREVRINTRTINKDAYFMISAIALLIILYLIGQNLSKIDGIILVLLFAFHVYREFKKRKNNPKKQKSKKEKIKSFYWLAIFILALVGLFISSNFVVEYASNLAIDFNLPDIIIGLFLLSIATTLPELVFGVSATNLNHKEMAIGDQIGSVIANTLLILGIVAIIEPIHTEFASFISSAGFMFISAIIFIIYIKTGRKLERIEGIGLIFVYILFMLIQFFIR